MTTITTRAPGRSDKAVVAAERRPTRALAVRRWFLVASPVLAGLFAIVGAYFDPAAGISGRQMYEIYTVEHLPLQLKSLGFHWSYAFWIAPALLIAPYVRGRGAWLANITAFVGFAGMTTLPGLLFIDWYDSAIGKVYGVDGVVAVNDKLGEVMWGVPWFTTPGIAGLMLALPLTAITLWRARLATWWALAAAVAGFLAFMLSNVMWWGAALTTVFFAVFAVALHRATDPARHAA